MDLEEIKDDIEEMIDERAEKKKGPKRSINRFLLIIIVVLLLIIAFVCLYYQHKLKVEQSKDPDITLVKPSDDVTISQKDLLRVITPASELVSYSYSYAGFDVYEKAKHVSWLNNVKVPFTTDKQVFAYSGKISAGIRDLKDIEFEVDNDNKTILVKMPEPEVLYNEITKFESYDIQNSIFTEANLGDSQEYIEALKDHEKDLLMNQDDFWSSLENNTQSIIGGLISSVNNIDEYAVEYSWPE